MRTTRVYLCFVALLLAPAAPAATVTYDMDLSVPGEFKIFASASAGDNYGLALYGLPLTLETTAMITGFEHLSPAVNSASDGILGDGTAGFTLLRSAGAGRRGLTFIGSQDTVSPSPYMVRGLGQSAGSFADLGLTTYSTSTQSTWGDSLLIARGSYAGDISKFHIDTNNNNLIANVFIDDSSTRVKQAQVQVRGIGFDYVPLPPPVVTPPVVTPVIPVPVTPPPPRVPPDNPPPVTPPVIEVPITPPPLTPRTPDGTRPVVTYGLDLSVPGEFKIFASASAGDNYGLACYGLPFSADTTDMITSYEHLSPASNSVNDGSLGEGTAGFTLLRTASNPVASGRRLTFAGAQDTVTPTPYLIRGLGQTAGSFSELGLTTSATATQPSWEESLLIARGTYTGDVSSFHIDNNSYNLMANVFTEASGTRVTTADVRVEGIGFDYVPLPPPVVAPPPPVTPPPVAPVEPPTVTPPVGEVPITPPPRPPRTTDGTRPVVTYNMDLSVPGEFKIFASASAGDNSGLVSYGVPLSPLTTSMITSFEHTSPAANSAINSNQEEGGAGFTLLRSTPIKGSGAMTFAGSQDTIAPTPHLIYGLGQQPGSFSELGLTTSSTAQQSEWSDSILIAQGTYSGEATDFTIDTSASDLFANVFAASNNGRVTKADVHVYGTNGFAYTPVLVPPTPPAPPGVVEPPTVEPPPPPIDEPVVETPPPTDPGGVFPVLPVDPSWPPDVTFPIVRGYPWYGEEWCVGFPMIDVRPAIDLTHYRWTLRAVYDGDTEITPAEWFTLDVTDAIYEPMLVTYAPEFADDRFLMPGTAETFMQAFYDGRLTTTRATTAGFLMNASGQLFYLGDTRVPEPSSALLACLALAAFAAAGERRRQTG